MSKEYHEQYHKRRQEIFDYFIKPNIDLNKAAKGKVIITSAPPDDGNNDFEFRKLGKDEK